jgi:hypothetical protein
LREGNYASFITDDVFKKLNDEAKYGGAPKQLIWEKVLWEDMRIYIHRSSWLMGVG